MTGLCRPSEPHRFWPTWWRQATSPPEQAEAARQTGPASIRAVFHTGRYFADWVRDQAGEYAGNDRDIVVQTTLDMGLQRKAEAALEAVLAGPGAKAGVSQGAIVILSPDGAVRAMVGGRDYATSQFNRATQGYRQPGSSFKAFLYLAAVEGGLNLDDTIEDVPITTGKYRPSNFNDKYEGTITWRHAFAESSNVSAVRLIERIGPKTVIAAARRLGITSPLHADASLALGTSETTLLEMTSAYAAFANGGDDVFPFGFAAVSDGPGHTVFQRQGGGTGRVIDRAALAKMTDLLVAVVKGGTGKAAAFDRPVGGKTGTTQDSRDAWFIGFTADYVAGVWLGNDDGTPMNRITGGSLPAKLWREVMVAAHQGLPVRDLAGFRPAEDAAEAGSESTGSTVKPAEEPAESDDSLWQSLVHLFGGGPPR